MLVKTRTCNSSISPTCRTRFRSLKSSKHPRILPLMMIRCSLIRAINVNTTRTASSSAETFKYPPLTPQKSKSETTERLIICVFIAIIAIIRFERALKTKRPKTVLMIICIILTFSNFRISFKSPNPFSNYSSSSNYANKVIKIANTPTS
jgi:hypothetical protein